mmetsp:Transcript_53899/g.148794  ORF Transcript_53899/g.148794 Transcript_53899/m.148794 type:complete len:140 (-) Transcript_53899:222-641(-)
MARVEVAFNFFERSIHLNPWTHAPTQAQFNARASYGGALSSTGNYSRALAILVDTLNTLTTLGATNSRKGAYGGRTAPNATSAVDCRGPSCTLLYANIGILLKHEPDLPVRESQLHAPTTMSSSHFKFQYSLITFSPNQ